jgi:hypothetical protein
VKYALLLGTLFGCGRIGFDATAAAPTSCLLDHPNLVACWSFDGNANDVSGVGLDAVASNVSYVPGRQGQAIQLDASSVVTVAETPVLDISQMTLMTWVRLDVAPAAGQRALIFDNNEQYALAIEAGAVWCIADLFTGPVPIKAGEWRHVACVRRASSFAAFIDGVLVRENPASGQPPTNGVEGSQIGNNIPDTDKPGPEPLLGALDDLQFLNLGLDDATICAAAGAC